MVNVQNVASSAAAAAMVEQFWNIAVESSLVCRKELEIDQVEERKSKRGATVFLVEVLWDHMISRGSKIEGWRKLGDLEGLAGFSIVARRRCPKIIAISMGQCFPPKEGIISGSPRKRVLGGIYGCDQLEINDAGIWIAGEPNGAVRLQAATARITIFAGLSWQRHNARAVVAGAGKGVDFSLNFIEIMEENFTSFIW